MGKTTLVQKKSEVCIVGKNNLFTSSLSFTSVWCMEKF